MDQKQTQSHQSAVVPEGAVDIEKPSKLEVLLDALREIERSRAQLIEILLTHHLDCVYENQLVLLKHLIPTKNVDPILRLQVLILYALHSDLSKPLGFRYQMPC